MKFESYFSSSKSNFYVVTAANGKKLLIECGCTWKQLINALDYKLENVVGCLLSHEHQDHAKAIEKVMENGIDVYSSIDTFEALGVLNSRAKPVEDCNRFKIDDTFEVFPFTLWADKDKSAYAHDVPIFGFIIFDMPQDECMLFVTDACVIVPSFGEAFSIISICCNYDGEILHALEEAGEINTELAKRLLNSHMEWHETQRYIRKYCNFYKCTEIHLLHMSLSNIDAEKVREEFEREFMTKTLIAGGSPSPASAAKSLMNGKPI